MKIRLHQFLSRTGIFKKKSDMIKAIRQSEIDISGKIVKNPHYQFDPAKEEVRWKGRKLSEIDNKVYIIMNKPQGYLSSKLTAKDKQKGEKSIFDIPVIEEITRNTLFSAGRLDKDTSGLIILTNDGIFGHRLSNPRFNIEKTYIARLDTPLDEKMINMLEAGIEIELEENGQISKHITKPSKIINISENTYSITLTEGKKREVKKIFSAAGKEVISLRRTRIAGLDLDSLELTEGNYMMITKEKLLDMLFSDM